MGVPEGAAENNDHDQPKGGRQELHDPDLEPCGQGAFRKAYTINGYVNDNNMVERVETWLGENIMGDMHIIATYTGWKDFGGAMAPSKIVQTRGGWPFFEVDVTSASQP